jgi:hypothetical protein
MGSEGLSVVRAASGLLLTVVLSGCGATRHDDSQGPSAPESQPATSATDCSPRPLATYCASPECPLTPEGVPLTCGDFADTERYATDCGGTAVSGSWLFGAVTWYFDADGVLTGVESSGDIGIACKDGTFANTLTYGTVCSKRGEPTSVCEEICGGPPVTDCGDEPTCPTNFRDLPIDACDDGGQVTSSPTHCDGTLATTTTADGAATHHCFDRWDRLIGVAHEDAEGRRSLAVGVDCEAAGEATNWCRKPG